jgi:hypothetical protein
MIFLLLALKALHIALAMGESAGAAVRFHFPHSGWGALASFDAFLAFDKFANYCRVHLIGFVLGVSTLRVK